MQPQNGSILGAEPEQEVLRNSCRVAHNSGESKYWVTYDYDLIGRVIEEDAPVSESVTSGAITATAYLGETVQVTDAESNVTKTEYNAVGQITKVIDGASYYATYTYKPFGELASMTDAESNTTTIGYDARGFKAMSSRRWRSTPGDSEETRRTGRRSAARSLDPTRLSEATRGMSISTPSG